MAVRKRETLQKDTSEQEQSENGKSEKQTAGKGSGQQVGHCGQQGNINNYMFFNIN